MLGFLLLFWLLCLLVKYSVYRHEIVWKITNSFQNLPGTGAVGHTVSYPKDFGIIFLYMQEAYKSQVSNTVCLVQKALETARDPR